ncbi:NAD-dependent epimerase/dehydratase family protein [Kribbella sp. NPDC050470]|uniref:NAD-dependent epimerase/dehydratase family protein n=1 Tax=unclassified Kribbella TaxID=2644121 RepID=UPI0037B5E886
MRIWVSGARGKLGSEVCRQLSAAGHDVVEADLVSPALGAVGDSIDLLDREAVARSLGGVEAIVHCAAIPSPENIAPADLVHINSMTTFNALEEAWKQGIRTAVLASSGSIYGTAWSPEELAVPEVPIDEETPPRYVDPYALTKDVLERTGEMYARRAMQVTALRFHWILTPGEVRRYITEAPPEDNRRNLWGYVDLAEAARACVLSLNPRPESDRYAALLIAAEDTGMLQPTNELLAQYLPDTDIRTDLPATASLYDCRRAADVIGWTHRSRWRE